MPVFNARSFLAVDREARGPEMKYLLRSKREMSCSDTTIMRVLSGVSLEGCATFLTKTARILNRKGLLHAAILDTGRSRRIGIFDGSVMSGHCLLVLSLHGKIDLPIEITDTTGHGYEAGTAIRQLKGMRHRLGPLMPDLIMGDALYFTKPMAHAIRNEGSHFLFKTKADKEWRTELDEADFFMKANRNCPGQVGHEQGFDQNRLAQWSIDVIGWEYDGMPVQIARIHEGYRKDARRSAIDFWVITSDLSLSPAEIREAAHLRWSIENNVFKRMNHLSGTKRFRCKSEVTCIKFLSILCAVVGALDAYLTSISIALDHKRRYEILRGMKPTWINLLTGLRREVVFLAG